VSLSQITDVFAARKGWEILTPPERRDAFVQLGLMLIGTALETLGVGLVIPAIALLTQPGIMSKYPALQPVLDTLGNPSHQALVVGAMLGLVGVYLFKALFLAFTVWYQMRYAYGIERQLSQRLFTSYLRQPYTFHLQRNSAQLIRNSMNEVSVFTFYVVIAGMTLLTEALVIPAICALLLVVEPVGALIVMGTLGAVAGMFVYATRGRIARWGEVRQLHEGLCIQTLQQGLGAAKDVKLLGREADFLEQYSTHNSQRTRMSRSHQVLVQLPRLGLELLAATGLAILVMTLLVQGREFAAILPTVGLFAAAAFRLMPSVNRILGSIQSLRFGLAVTNLLHDELKLAVPAASPSGAARVPFRETLAFDRVTFTYPEASVSSLRNLSLVVRRGESVGFIGASGAGKSTLVDVLLGLLTPDSGEVRVDGDDIQKFLRGWQDQIGYVPQTIYLTDDSLRRNVAFGLSREHIDDDAVWRAIRAAQLEEFVRCLPQGLDTVVGERGVRLSGGQRQRIGIARALYHDPGVLVLDEATSSLDAATERDVMQAVRALHGTKTILIVAHRISTVEHCDRLYRLEEGGISATGTPQTILESRVSA
jgi:ABC-type multidrug transport system fused ATPase/permease subunit